jgi:hypothetical protein
MHWSPLVYFTETIVLDKYMHCWERQIYFYNDEQRNSVYYIKGLSGSIDFLRNQISKNWETSKQGCFLFGF